MITVVRIDNPFEPHRRKTSQIEFVKGMTTEDVCVAAAADDLIAGVVAHNGELLRDSPARSVEDGDFVTIAISPGGLEIAAMTFWEALFWSYIVGKIAAAMMPKLDMEATPESNYGYHGFDNSYLSEGAPVPLVYGTMRTAAPCINQTILGGPLGLTTSGLSSSRVETLNTLLAISEGPIYGLGDFVGPVTVDHEQDALVNGQSLPVGLEMLVNGIPAEALDGAYRWRTGDQNQSSLHGNSGFIDSEFGGFTLSAGGASTNYSLDLRITHGTDGIVGTAGEYPEGLVDYANRIIESDTTQFASFTLAEKASLANLQLFFERGLYSGGNDGTPDNQLVTMRVQYWETDAAGSALGTQVMILPPLEINEAASHPLGVDFRFELWDVSTVGASTQGGYLVTDTVNYNMESAWMRLTDAGGLQKVDPGEGGFYGGCWLRNYDQNYTGQSDYFANTAFPFSWSDEDAPSFHSGGWYRNFTFGGGRGSVFPRHSVGFNGWCLSWGPTYPNGVDSDGNPDYDTSDGRNLVLCTWITDPTGSNTHRSRYSSQVFTGFNENDSGWIHVGFKYTKNHEYDANDTSVENAGDSVTFYLNGIAYSGAYQGSDGSDGFRIYPQRPYSGSVFSIGNYLNSYGENNNESGWQDESLSGRNYVQGVFLVAGDPPEGLFLAAATREDPISGNANFTASSMASLAGAKVLYDCFYPQGTQASGAANQYYVNHAMEADSTTEAEGVHHVFVSVPYSGGSPDYTKDAPNSESRLWTLGVGTPTKSYYKVEVFKDKGDGPHDSNDQQDTVTVSGLSTFDTQDYTYPGTAVLSVALTATDQVNNSQPELTTLVHGIMVPIWVGGDDVYPEFERRFSRNPAWIALDLITNRRYGMGEIFAPNGTYELVDLQSFLEWANFCDTGVPDGSGTVEVFGVNTDGYGTGLGAISQRLWIGLIDKDGIRVQSLPQAWIAGAHVSITDVLDGLPQTWKTSDDVEGGLHDASNRLEIHEISFHSDSSAAGFHGWKSYVIMRILLNRDPGNNYGENWGDQIAGDSTTLTAAALANTANVAWLVDDNTIFSSLPTADGQVYYLRLTASDTGATETVLYIPNADYEALGYIEIARAQLGTVVIEAPIGSTVGLLVKYSLLTVGGYETRCAFDGVFDQKDTAGWDALLQVFQVGRAMPVKAGAKIIAVVDQPRDPVALFGQGNIKEGSFTLTYMSSQDKPNSLTVRFLDDKHNYEGRTVIVDHPSTFGGAGICSIAGISNQESCIAANGTWVSDDPQVSSEYMTRRSESLEAKGVVRRSQATRDATYRLNRYHLQRRSATFDVGPDAIHLLPGDRILVSHDTPQYGYSGRIPETGVGDNMWPGGGPDTTIVPSLLQSFSSTGDPQAPLTAGGGLWRGARGMVNAYQPAAVVPPLVAYSQNQSPTGKGVVMYRESVMDGEGAMPAGLAAFGQPTACFDHDKFNTGGFSAWTSQFGYPSDSAMQSNGVDVDVIASTTHKSCFSIYVKEPDKGASRGFYLNLYRRFNEDLTQSAAVGKSKSYYGTFRWIGGDLTATGLTMSAAMSQSVEEISGGWWRATVTVNWADITDVTPAFAVGWHIQPRVYLYDYQDNGDNGYSGILTTYGLWKGVTVDADGNGVTWYDSANNTESSDTACSDASYTTAATCLPPALTWTGNQRRGRGNQFLAYGDPLKFNTVVWDGDGDGTATAAWTALNKDNTSGSDTANNLWGLASTPPPFYPESKSSGTETQGKYGYVHGFYAGKTGAANYLSAKQVINLNATTSSGTAADPAPTGGANWLYHFDRFNGRNGYGNFKDEPMVLSFFFRKGRNGNVETKFEARLMFNNSVDGNGQADELYAAVEITIPASSGDPTFAYTLNQTGSTSSPDLHWAQYNTTGATTYTGNATYAAKVRQNSSDVDAEWYYVRIAAYCDLDFRAVAGNYTGHLGVQFIMGATGGADASLTGVSNIWGVRLSGLAGDSVEQGGATEAVRYYSLDNTGRHRGLEFWGPMYETGTETASTYGTGMGIQLDRDVTLDAGKSYEVLVRQSGAEADAVLATDLQQSIAISADEIPSSGSKVIPARTAIGTATPDKFIPSTGDIYSFGESGKATEDFTVLNIKTDPNTLVRTMECVEYHEAIYNDTQWGLLGDATISALGAGASGSSAAYAMGGGSQPEDLSLSALASSYRGPSGEPIPRVSLRWSLSGSTMPFPKVNIWVSQLDAEAKPDGSYRESSPQLVATCPASPAEYQHDGPSLQPDRQYKFRLQPVGQKGTSRALRKCPYIIVTPVVNTPLAPSPTVSVSLRGKKQMYKVAATGTARDYAIEGRIGGWIVSTPAWIIDPNTDHFVSEGLLPVPTNDAGSAQTFVIARSKLLNGAYGNATKVIGTEALVDVRASRQVIAENDIAAVQSAITGELQIVTGTTDVIQWTPSSTSVAEQTWRMTEINAVTPRRTVINAIIEGYQERPETFSDFAQHTLGSQIGRNWSIEGPMQDDGYNGSVTVEWRWTSGADITGVDFRPFEPGEIYAQKVQFRVLFNRAAITINDPADGATGTVTGYAQTKVTRFTVIENDQPNEHFVDGGTF